MIVAWYSPILCFSAGLDPDDISLSDSDFDEDNEDPEDDPEDLVDDDLEDRIPDDELEGLEEDLLQDPEEMPAAARRKTPAKKKAGEKDADVAELTSRTAAVSISKKPAWYSAAFAFPYKIYTFSLEDHTRRQMNIDIIGPSLPDAFIRHAKVLPGGNSSRSTLDVLAGFLKRCTSRGALATIITRSILLLRTTATMWCSQCARCTQTLTHGCAVLLP